MKSYYADYALLSTGWCPQVRFQVINGQFANIQANSKAQVQDIHLSGPILPGMVNLHSHAFQRAMAGLAEVSLNPADSFWSWRDLMYGLVNKLTPEQVQTIASFLYIDMLKAGYTQVAEFHYLHHQSNGQAYDNPATMALAVRDAALDTGIGQTLLPVLYSHSDFGGQPANDGQKRFLHDVDSYLQLQQQLHDSNTSSRINQGLCFHSLRAVTKAQIQHTLAASNANWPIHIHIAEQQKEVNNCISWSGQRPVAWLANEIGLNDRWCLVHATHIDDRELQQIIQSQAVVGICPSTEANLGDGIFPAAALAQGGGRFGIGSDSHVCLSPAEEIRLLEYSQRLQQQQRNRLYDENHASVGNYMYQKCVADGAAACGLSAGLAEGNRADFISLDISYPTLACAAPEKWLDLWCFGSNHNPVRDVYVAGNHVINQGQHHLQDSTYLAMQACLKQLR
ncbi:MAG: formimidoylglutamate deiminase [Gammaproteobacteria bacterium]|nr:formimidoylglutamate deiminase [Gammaproteobacteria bacterium]MCP4879667.1 formimidoylglutamate deiminase [Gammaproteobacteria bacterium]MDP6164650.1 formimidoylglutamate deiminase [Gammaproteobacteria bacterium]